MNKYLFALIFLLTACIAVAQKKPTPVQLIRSETAFGSKIGDKDLIKAYKAVFRQDNTTLSSDSAYFYPQDNLVDAFGHVVIIQADTVHIYSDKLHYDGNTKIALLTDNVKMIDKDATLTTNYFTYNTGTRYGTYTGGGKLVNKENTIVSQNGYYLGSTHDAYFRYNVVLNTKDAVIKNDTLRYNSDTRIAFFYGPTNIYGKDKDTLYTENGTYNTAVEQAFFSKNNEYRKGTRTLKGDSLFYDRLKGYGKAMKHVTFTDREQKVVIKGDLGEYTRDDERTIMTIHPYVVFVTVDSVKTDSVKTDSVKTDSAKMDSIANKAKVASKTNSKKPGKDKIAKPDTTAPPIHSMPIQIAKVPEVKADTTSKKSKIAEVKTGKGGKKGKPDTISKKDKLDTIALKTRPKVKRDSIYLSGDTIETYITTYQALRYLTEQRKIAGDSTIKAKESVVYTKPPKFLELAPPKYFNKKDYLHPDYFPKQVVVRDTTSRKAKLAAARRAAARAKQAKEPPKIDSVYLSQKILLSDTARIRVLSAYHHAKIFKSDLQAKADSIFYSYADSTARMFVNPIIWAENSQLSGDTVNLQMKNRKVDNIEMFPKGLIVNIEKKDSTHFNQIGGRKMRGYFKNSKLYVVYVDGNAETIYFRRDSTKVTELLHSIGSRIRVNFKNNQVSDATWYYKPIVNDKPIFKVKDEETTLKDFQWKPKERPISKEAVIGYPDDGKTPVKKPAAVKEPVTAKPATAALNTTTKPTVPVAKPVSPAAKPTVTTTTPVKLKMDSAKTKADTTKQIKANPGSLKPGKAKADATKQIKAKPDTVKPKKIEFKTIIIN